MVDKAKDTTPNSDVDRFVKNKSNAINILSLLVFLNLMDFLRYLGVFDMINNKNINQGIFIFALLTVFIFAQWYFGSRAGEIVTTIRLKRRNQQKKMQE